MPLPEKLTGLDFDLAVGHLRCRYIEHLETGSPFTINALLYTLKERVFPSEWCNTSEFIALIHYLANKWVIPQVYDKNFISQFVICIVQAGELIINYHEDPDQITFEFALHL